MRGAGNDKSHRRLFVSQSFKGDGLPETSLLMFQLVPVLAEFFNRIGRLAADYTYAGAKGRSRPHRGH